MVLAGLIGASGWFYLAAFAETPFEATAASIVASLGVAISDVVADSIVVEKVRPKELLRKYAYELLLDFQPRQKSGIVSSFGLQFGLRNTVLVNYAFRSSHMDSYPPDKLSTANLPVPRCLLQARDSDSQAVAGGLQSLCWGAAAAGGVVSAYFSGSLLETMTTREVFSLTAFLPLLITACAIFIDEKRQAGSVVRCGNPRRCGARSAACPAGVPGRSARRLGS